MKTVNVWIPVHEKQDISRILDIPYGRSPKWGMVIAHGAGNDLRHPLLAYLANGLAEKGVLILRFNFVYRERGKSAVDTQELLYAAWHAAMSYFRTNNHCKAEDIVVAGKSLGGRIASQMVSENLLDAERLIFFGYPLHAPGRHDRLRDTHLYNITKPMLFFAGTRDPLCDLDLLKNVLSKISIPHDLSVIEGADHSFNLSGQGPRDPLTVYRKILDKTWEWLNEGLN